MQLLGDRELWEIQVSSFQTLLTVNSGNPVFAQEIVKHFKGQICDYLKRTKVSQAKFFFI